MPIVIVKNGKIQSISTNTRQLTGETIPGDLASWLHVGTDPNEILTLNYDLLCQRSTTLFHTHAPVSSAINKATIYGIGSGLLYRSTPDWSTLGVTKEYAESWGREFQKIVHYYFTLTNFYEKQSVLFRTAKIMGDSLLFFVRDETENGLPFDLIEAGGDQIDFQGTAKGNQTATLGIIHDKYMRRKGIILNNGDNINFKDDVGDQNVIQFYEKQMARQLRGFPSAYKIIALAKNNSRHWDAVTARAVMETIILGSSFEDTDNARAQALELAKQVRNEAYERTNQLSDTQAEQQSIAGVVPGSVLTYKTGSEGMKFTDLKTPSNNFDKLQGAFIDVVGMAFNQAPEFVMSKYSTSYTAHKGALNDTMQGIFMSRNLFAKSVLRPVVMEIAKYAFLEKLIDPPNGDFFTNPIIAYATIAGNYLGPVVGHINPKVEMEAKKIAVEEAFNLRSSVNAEFGNEWDDFILRWQREEEEFGKKSTEEKEKAIIDQEKKLIEEANSQEEQNQDDEVNE